MRVRQGLLLGTAFVLAGACGGSSESHGDSCPFPGDTVGCVCPGQSDPGTRTCQDDGSWGDCDCSIPSGNAGAGNGGASSSVAGGFAGDDPSGSGGVTVGGTAGSGVGGNVEPNTGGTAGSGIGGDVEPASGGSAGAGTGGSTGGATAGFGGDSTGAGAGGLGLSGTSGAAGAGPLSGLPGCRIVYNSSDYCALASERPWGYYCPSQPRGDCVWQGFLEAEDYRYCCADQCLATSLYPSSCGAAAPVPYICHGNQIPPAGCVDSIDRLNAYCCQE